MYMMEEFVVTAVKKLCTTAVYSWVSLSPNTANTAPHIRVSTIVNEAANEATISGIGSCYHLHDFISIFQKRLATREGTLHH
jgi:hypothetical protein